MKVKSNLVYSSSTGKLIGFVELGSINDEIHNLEKSCSDEENKENDIATHILASMVRGIFTNLQFAFAFFPRTGFTCAQLFPCVWEAVSVLEALPRSSSKMFYFGWCISKPEVLQIAWSTWRSTIFCYQFMFN